MSARAKAEACFALARSTTFEGERSNAIAQGTRIAEAAGLDLDTFDIPGRVRATKPRPMQREGDMFGFAGMYQSDELQRAMEELAARMSGRVRASYDSAFMNIHAKPCPMCGVPANECRAGAPCYGCVPPARHGGRA